MLPEDPKDIDFESDDWRYADERDPAFLAYLLRPDTSFRTTRAMTRFPYDEDGDAYICHIQAGYDRQIESSHLRQAFRTGSIGEDLDHVLMEVLGELSPNQLNDLITKSGASPREIACFIRAQPHEYITLPMSSVLNGYSREGHLPLPYVIDKLVQVDYEQDIVGR